MLQKIYEIPALKHVGKSSNYMNILKETESKYKFGSEKILSCTDEPVTMSCVSPAYNLLDRAPKTKKSKFVLYLNIFL